MYRSIVTELWTDPEVKRLSPVGKLLFVYLITNPHTHLCGIYYLPKPTIRKETKITERECDTLLGTLSQAALAWYDDSNEVVFVTQMFRYQGRGTKNELAASKQLLTLHQSSLIKRFLTIYPQVFYPNPDTLSDTLSDTVSHISAPVPDPVLLVSSPNPEGEKIVKKRGNGSALGVPIPEDFAPSESHVKLAKARGLELNIEVLHFKGKAQEKGWLASNWGLKFTNWMLQEIKFRAARRT